MKKAWLLALLFLLAGCEQELSEQEKFFAGKHALFSINTQSGTSDGSCYMIFGSQGSTVKFAWLNNNKEYMLTELPIGKIRVVLDDYAEPFVKFRWWLSSSGFSNGNYADSIVYAQLNIPPGKFVYNLAVSTPTN
jgi:hypothetical protein